MSKNIIVCCDGTNNQFGVCNTNVVRIAQLIERDSDRQICYYDPGIGTLPELGFRATVRERFSRLRAQAFATDLHEKVCIAYAHLMEVWEPGDKVFLFGFSRGAYTARLLAAVLHALGLLPRGNAQLLPYVVQLFSSMRHDSPRAYWSLIDAFRSSFARPISGSPDSRFPIHFLGVWDTVSSVGWVWDPPAYPFTAHNPSVAIVRHAIALDERRWFFRQNRITPDPAQDAQELWFAGVHGDVGGGYPEQDGGLWRIPFEWMLREATTAGLLVDVERLAEVRSKSEIPVKPWGEPQHESLEGPWWVAEVVPKLVYQPSTKRSVLSVGLGHHRTVQDGALLDGSVLERIRRTGYAPPNLSEAFVARVKALPTVPATYPYTS
jgi:uncharacterized protein (DUF2235 family)